MAGTYFGILNEFSYFYKVKSKQNIRPKISDTLLWEYDLKTFNWVKSYKIVIERVLERGNLEEWKEIVKFYSKKKILETIEWSAQIRSSDKKFSRFFLNSEFLNAA